MKILIQSRARPHVQRTWNCLPSQLREITNIVVREEEARSYQVYEPYLWLVPNFERLGNKRQYIIEHIEDEKIVLLDDDLDFQRRIAPDDWHLRNVRGDELIELFQRIDVLLEEYDHVGVSLRQGNNREPTPMVHCKRYCRVLAYRRSAVTSCDFVRSLGLEDFDVNLQLLTRGRPSAIITDWAQGQPETNWEGGCSVYRTRDQHESSVNRLQELWPKFVRKRYVNNKTSGEFGSRAEVTIAWKKAYLSSGARWPIAT